MAACRLAESHGSSKTLVEKIILDDRYLAESHASSKNVKEMIWLTVDYLKVTAAQKIL
jgi:hypothetical protein